MNITVKVKSFLTIQTCKLTSGVYRGLTLLSRPPATPDPYFSYVWESWWLWQDCSSAKMHLLLTDAISTKILCACPYMFLNDG